MTDKIRPSHYRGKSGVEVKDVLDAHYLGPHLWQAMAYVMRAGRKPGEDALVDWKKAEFYFAHALRREGHWFCAGQSAVIPMAAPEDVIADFDLTGVQAKVVDIVLRMAQRYHCTILTEGESFRHHVERALALVSAEIREMNVKEAAA